MKKILLKGFSMILVLLMVTTSLAFAAESFPDVAGKNYETPIEKLVEEGVITGDKDGLFHPEDNLTRAQACIMIVKTINPPASLVNGTATQEAFGNNFTDMKGYSWVQGYISYAVEYGIVKGYPDGTFKPGEKVSSSEMITMIIRACGYANLEGTWPENYKQKAAELNLLTGLSTEMPQYATKWMMAQADYNAMELMKKNAPVIEEQPQGTDRDKPQIAPVSEKLNFTTGKIDSTMKSFAGKDISSKVKIYIYGKQADYNKEMYLPNVTSDYRLDTIYKFKNTKTPAWYEEENGKITVMVLPMDAGYTGMVFGVVNATEEIVNINGEKVTGFETMVAGNKVTWYGKSGVTVPVFTEGDGLVYELVIANGQVTSILPANGSDAQYEKFAELTPAHTWTLIHEYNDKVIKLTNETGELIAVRDNATIYEWNADKKEYKQGTLYSIKKGREVRLYTISDKNGVAADLVIIK